MGSKKYGDGTVLDDEDEIGYEDMPELEEGTNRSFKKSRCYCNARQRAMDLPPMGIHEDCGIVGCAGRVMRHNLVMIHV